VASAPESETAKRIAEIVKFGIPGTDMPGHEYLPDQQISSIGMWVAQNMSFHQAPQK